MELETGPISALLEAAAGAIGVGMVLGGFFAGVIGRLLLRTRDDLERDVVAVGYIVAVVCLAARLAEIAQII